jgi:CRP/FNR family transcriptional regulator, anaerobic regulatory protein
MRTAENGDAMKAVEKDPADFPFPGGLPPALLSQLREHGRTVRLAAGDVYLHEHAAVETFALVRSGALRVFKTGENGREITLYGVGPGECCTVNVLCLLSGRPSPAAASAETAVEAIVYPRRLFLRWVADHEAMRTFVFGILADKVGDMMALIEEVAFQRMDRRLAAYLLERTDVADPVLECTHETVAADLGTAREVVSRLLKSFEQRGLLSLTRGRIRIEDPAALRDASI